MFEPEKPLYGLQLNSIYHRMEEMTLVAVSYDKDKLMEFVNSTLVEPYREEIAGRTMYKVFRQGSKLEDFNAPHSDDCIVVWKSVTDFSQEYSDYLQHLLTTLHLE